MDTTAPSLASIDVIDRQATRTSRGVETMDEAAVRATLQHYIDCSTAGDEDRAS